MNSYFIQSLGGLSMGMWEGNTAQEALLEFYRKRGYTSEAVWLEEGQLSFADDVLDIFGNAPNTWLIEKIN
jgi:hypothetical protein